MPIKINDHLPAKKSLINENIFVISESRATHQDIRPLKIAILNLMPEKPKTELHLMRRLSNTPIQIEVDLVKLESHECKNTAKEHLEEFYIPSSEMMQRKYDGLIITGAPVENLKFEEVDYWTELTTIMEWAKHNVCSTLHICWASQAGLKYHFGIDKFPLDSKQFGVFKHKVNNKHNTLMQGFDDIFWAPHSRHTTVRKEDIASNKELVILSYSDEAGVYIAASKDGRFVFVTGHSEYDADTLKQEYERDLKKGIKINPPLNYFPHDDPNKEPIVKWRSHSTLFFSNWINYYVYQCTPFDIGRIN